MTIEVSAQSGYISLLNTNATVAVQSAFVLLYSAKLTVATQSAYVMLSVGTRVTVASQSAFIAIFDPNAGITKRRRVSTIMSSYAA